jgi:sugar O-acyltransferase (sialic acid O-acetyltransferase NeuD family)
MKDILIYGFGGFGHEVACIINQINDLAPTWNIIGYMDDGVEVGTECKYGRVLGGIDVLNAWKTPVSVVIAVGSPKYLEQLPSKITNPLVEFPNIIAPNVFYFDKESVVFGKGNIITFDCRFSCNIKIGDFNVLDGCISLGHDVELGSYNMLFPEVRISGQTIVGDKNFFGSRCFVAQCLKIGNENRFGAGSFVLRKIKDGGLYMGNPAKKVSID